MIIKHLRREFYDTLFGKRILIIANQDVDAVCSVKIITELLRIDGITFSLCPIDGLATFQQAYREYCKMVHVIMLVNCGAGVDILEMLDRPKDKVFFVLDSHRPIHVANYYDETNQIRLLTLDEKIEIPTFDEIFRSELSDSEDDNDSSEEDMVISENEEDEGLGGARRKRQRKNSRTTRREYSAWVERRNELLFDYSQFSYHATPSALIALELSWSMSRGDMQYVWWSTVSLSDAMMLEKIPRRDYVVKATELSRHIARIAHAQDTPRDCLKVTFEKELCFYLYRHWNLYESIKMTPSSATVLKTWSLKGECRFHEMLGELGFPLQECKQKYVSMDLRFRKKVKEAFCDPLVRSKYKFDDITIGSFISTIGYRPSVSAFDCQLACLALLENPSSQHTTVDNFLEALSSLSKKNYDTVDKGIDLAKVHLTATYRQVQEFINMNSVNRRGGFLFVNIPEGAPNASYFRSPSCLSLLAQFTQKAVVANGPNRWASLPLVLCTPQTTDWWSIIGIRPLNYDLSKNLFGKMFETLADRMPGMVLMDAFDPNIIQVKAEQKEKFVELLEACMV